MQKEKFEIEHLANPTLKNPILIEGLPAGNMFHVQDGKDQILALHIKILMILYLGNLHQSMGVQYQINLA